jgi:hypothetical protein
MDDGVDDGWDNGVDDGVDDDEDDGVRSGRGVVSGSVMASSRRRNPLGMYHT